MRIAYLFEYFGCDIKYLRLMVCPLCLFERSMCFSLAVSRLKRALIKDSN